MPAAMKDLHVGKSLGDLNKQAALPADIAKKGPTVLAKSADTVLRNAVDSQLNGDEEAAYVLYMRYLELYKAASSTAEFKKQKEFYNSRFGMTNVTKALKQAELLSESLRDRYERREAQEVAAKLPSPGTALPDTTSDDIDDLLPSSTKNKNGNVIASGNAANGSKPAANGSSGATAPAATGSGAATASKPPTNGSFGGSTAPAAKAVISNSGGVGVAAITCEQLYSLLYGEDATERIVVMDMRPAADFADSHIRHSDCISVPADCAPLGCTVSRIEPLLPADSLSAWRMRGSCGHIVLLDADSGASSVDERSPLMTLKKAIYMYDQKVIVQSEPLVLDGGYARWLRYYPQYTTNAAARSTATTVATSNGKSGRGTVSLGFQPIAVTIEYPDFEDETRLAKGNPASEQGMATAASSAEAAASAAAGSTTSVGGAVRSVPTSGGMPVIDRSTKPLAGLKGTISGGTAAVFTSSSTPPIRPADVRTASASTAATAEPSASTSAGAIATAPFGSAAPDGTSNRGVAGTVRISESPSGADMQPRPAAATAAAAPAAAAGQPRPTFDRSNKPKQITATSGGANGDDGTPAAAAEAEEPASASRSAAGLPPTPRSQPSAVRQPATGVAEHESHGDPTGHGNGDRQQDEEDSVEQLKRLKAKESQAVAKLLRQQRQIEEEIARLKVIQMASRDSDSTRTDDEREEEEWARRTDAQRARQAAEARLRDLQESLVEQRVAPSGTAQEKISPGASRAAEGANVASTESESRVSASRDTGATAGEAVAPGSEAADKVAGPMAVDELAAAATAKAAAAKAAAAEETAAADKAAALSAAAERAATERAAAAAEKATAERAAAERAAAAEKAAAERAAAERATAERAAAAEKAAAERAAAERAAAAEKAAAERAAVERAAAERAAAERAAAERAAAERAAAERAAAERAAAERAAAERAAADRAAAERASAERIAAVRAAEERVAAERKAAEESTRSRMAAEKAFNASAAAASPAASADRMRADDRTRVERSATDERARTAAAGSVVAATLSSTRGDMPSAGAGSSAADSSSVRTQALNDRSTSSSAMKRTRSQPNLDRLVDDEPAMVMPTSLQRVPLVPNVERALKPPTAAPRPVPPRQEQRAPSAVHAIQVISADRLRDFDPSYGKTLPGVTGLYNMGNTCYLNAVIQCLSNTKPLTFFFTDDTLYAEHINNENPEGTGGTIAMEFSLLLKLLWTGNYRYVVPRRLKNVVGSLRSQFAGFQQQDCQELLVFLLDALHEDLNSAKKAGSRPPVPPPQVDPMADGRRSDNEAAHLSWEEHELRNQSVITALFQGQCKSTVTCSKCGWKSRKFDVFQYLALEIPPNASRPSLQDCLRMYLGEERIEGFKCDSCKKLSTASKKIDLWRLPPVLLVFFKRFKNGFYVDEFSKIGTTIDYPVDSSLDMRTSAPVGSPASAAKPYSLFAVANHYGTMNSGHYTAFCKNAWNSSWYKFNDETVSPVSTSEVKSAAAYVLFYTNM